ncbi:hypothetical protein DINM_000438, partial [Dirofilaria immitis]|nr:hypothetical protein [Dirofilaria immitis]
MNAIASLKLQSFNNNRARRNVTGIAGAIGAGFGLGAALIATNIGNVWKTGTSSSQIVQAGTASPSLTADTKCCSDVARRRIKKYVGGFQVILLAFGVPNLFGLLVHLLQL